MTLAVGPTRVLFLRHGQSEWNLSGRWQGQADPPLTDLGRSQAHAAALSLGEVDAVCASDLQRAAETAAIISNDLGVGPVVLDSGLRERDVGEWQGLTRVEIEEQFPGYLPPPGAEARVGVTVRRPPSWEQDDSVLDRVAGALWRIRHEVGAGEVLAVAHAGILYALEGGLGGSGERLGNLDGRWFDLVTDVGSGGSVWTGADLDQNVRLGDRIQLLDADRATMPRNL
jgi:probable phosphoglycerate mutase